MYIKLRIGHKEISTVLLICTAERYVNNEGLYTAVIRLFCLKAYMQ